MGGYLDGHPLQRELAPFGRVQSLVCVPTETEVADLNGEFWLKRCAVPHFHDEVLRNQNISGGQVAVDEVLTGQVGHPVRDLPGEADQLLDGQPRLVAAAAAPVPEEVAPMGPDQPEQVPVVTVLDHDQRVPHIRDTAEHPGPAILIKGATYAIMWTW